MKYLLILLLLIFPLGQLGRINIWGSELVLHLNDLAVFLVVLLSLFRQPKQLIQSLKDSRLTTPLGLWLSAIIISLILNSPNLSVKELLVSILYPVRFFVYAGLYFVWTINSEALDSTKTKRWLTILVFVVAMAGILQFIFLPNVTFLKAADWDDHYFRAVSTFLDPGFTGAILAFGLILAFLSADKLTIAVTYIALALTYSRASYLMYLVGFALISFFRKSWKIFVVAVTILVLTTFILPKTNGEGTKLTRENSIFARINNWKQSLYVWQTSPLFGVGFNTYRYSQNKLGLISAKEVVQSHAGAGADSSLLLVLATTGVFGLASYLFLLWTMWRISRRDLLFVASFGAVLVHSWFNNTLFYPWVMEWLWILLAISHH